MPTIQMTAPNSAIFFGACMIPASRTGDSAALDKKTDRTELCDGRIVQTLP